MRRILAGWLLLMLAQEACAHDVSKGLKGLNPGKTAALDRVGALNLSLEAHQAFFSIVRRDSVWTTSSVSVCFGPADAVTNRQPLIEKIISVANEWATGTKVAFDWGAKPYRTCLAKDTASVRVNVSEPPDENGALFTSLIGNDAKSSSIEGYDPYSMTLLFPAKSDYYDRTEVFRFYVLHEFGHALGFEHEHQRVDCDFDWEYVAAHFNFADAAEAKANMGKIFRSTIHAYPDNAAVIDGDFITTKYDNYSVMKYNLSTTASPGGDDPAVYADGAKSPCYRSGWVSQLTKFDRAGMTKAYGEPLIAVSAIAQNLQDSSGALNADLKQRLSSPSLGRKDVFAAVSIKSKRGQLPTSMLTDEERDVKSDFETLKKFPGAIELLKSVLAERAQH